MSRFIPAASLLLIMLESLAGQDMNLANAGLGTLLDLRERRLRVTADARPPARILFRDEFRRTALGREWRLLGEVPRNHGLEGGAFITLSGLDVEHRDGRSRRMVRPNTLELLRDLPQSFTAEVAMSVHFDLPEDVDHSGHAGVKQRVGVALFEDASHVGFVSLSLVTEDAERIRRRGLAAYRVYGKRCLLRAEYGHSINQNGRTRFLVRRGPTNKISSNAGQCPVKIRFRIVKRRSLFNVQIRWQNAEGDAHELPATGRFRLLNAKPRLQIYAGTHRRGRGLAPVEMRVESVTILEQPADV